MDPTLVALLGGGLLVGIVALLKYQPERDGIVVDYTRDAVLIQKDVMNDLRVELQRAHDLNDAAQTLMQGLERRVDELEAELAKARDELAAATRDRKRLRAENDRLQERVGELENEVGFLRSRPGPTGPAGPPGRDGANGTNGGGRPGGRRADDPPPQ